MYTGVNLCSLMIFDALGYSGLGVAFKMDDVLFASTESAERCSTPELFEYIRTVIISGKLHNSVIEICYFSSYMLTLLHY